MNVSAYSGIYQDDRKPIKDNWDLLAKVMQHKQSEYDSAFANLNNLKQQSLNIRFLNDDKQKEVDGLNKELTDKFNDQKGDFGDLSSTQNVNNYLGWFDKIANNTSLINAYQVDKKWQNELSTIDSIKYGKDPRKAGYHPENEKQFRDKLMEYKSSKDVNSTPFTPYTPFVDTLAIAQNIFKMLPKRKEVIETLDPDHPGWKLVTTKEGYTPEHLELAMQNLDDSGKQQYAIYAENIFNKNYNSNPQGYSKDIANRIVGQTQSYKAYYQDKLDKATGQLAVATDDGDKQQLSKAIADSTTALNNLDNKTADYYAALPKSTLLAYDTQLFTKKNLQNVSLALSGTKSIEHRRDDAYFANANLTSMNSHFDANFKYRESQDFNNNLFEKERLRIANRALDIKESKLKASITDAQGNPQIFNNTQESYAPNDALKTINNLWDIQNKVNADAVNILDEKTIPIFGRQQPIDYLIGQLLLKKGEGNLNYTTFINKLNADNASFGLSRNASGRVLKTTIDELAGGNKLDGLGTQAKIEAVKQRMSNTLSGQVFGNDAQKDADEMSDAQQLKSFVDKKVSSAYNDAKVKFNLPGNQSYDTFSKGQKDLVNEGALNALRSSVNTIVSTHGKEYNFSAIGDNEKSSTENNADVNAKIAARIHFASVLQSRTGGAFIPPEAIEQVTHRPDGTMTYVFKPLRNANDTTNNKEFNISSIPNISGVQKNANGYQTVTIKMDDMVYGISPVNQIIAGGEEYKKNVFVDGKPIKIKMYNNGSQYIIQTDELGIKKFNISSNGNPIAPSDVLDQFTQSLPMALKSLQLSQAAKSISK